MASHNPQPMLYNGTIRAFQHERAELIDRLVRHRSVLAYVKGHLEAEKLVAAKVLGRIFTPSQEKCLNDINTLLREGLFGDGK